MKVLVAEDNERILQDFCDILEREGFKTLRAKDGKRALELYSESSPDFICLDILMEGLTGFDVCREIRKTNTMVPIVFISSKSETSHKVAGLEIGADDYIVKPFDVIEVTARIRAITRRCLSAAPENDKDKPFMFADAKVMPRELRLEKGDRTAELSLREVKLLRLFADNDGKLVDRNMLLDHCWGTHIMPESRTVDWHIAQLRKKVEADPANPRLIKTIHGAGYKFDSKA
jgi:two-component system, OmpR family, alkaline phosphatase synthesis response regulator PhoP